MDRVVRVVGRKFVVKRLDKVFFPDSGYTKADIIDYYLNVSEAMIPHLKNRPLVFTRYPDGIDGKWFYQKDKLPGAPDWIKTHPYYADSSERTIEYCLCADSATLAWLASQACLEIHPWMSQIDADTNPDYAAFDLDPAEPAGFDEARDCAFKLRKILHQLDIEPIIKTSGATGLHMYVPVKGNYTYEQTREFVREVGTIMLKRFPDLVTLERIVKNRTGKVYIDYLQNYRGKTLVAPYSIRPRRCAPVSTPIDWSELDQIVPEQFTIKTVPGRLKKRPDPFQAMFTSDYKLPLASVR